MDSPVTKLIFIAAAVAASALVVAVMWGVLGRNAPPANDGIDYTKIQTENLCNAVDGTWASNACTS
jgi:hypothetical protein